MDISGDEIADVVLREFDRWPNKRKPLLRSDGVKEWVPLSGIVAQGFTPDTTADHKADSWNRQKWPHMSGCSVCAYSCPEERSFAENSGLG